MPFFFYQVEYLFLESTWKYVWRHAKRVVTREPLRNGERKCKSKIEDERGWDRERRGSQVVTSAPYGKMQKGATVNWTRHTNSSSFSSSQEYRVSFSSGWLFKLLRRRGAKLTTELKNTYIFIMIKVSVNFFWIMWLFYKLMYLLSWLIINMSI